jgi:hypothetical protein
MFAQELLIYWKLNVDFLMTFVLKKCILKLVKANRYLILNFKPRCNISLIAILQFSTIELAAKYFDVHKLYKNLN